MSDLDFKKQFENHNHDGVNSKKIDISTLFDVQDSIANPTGGITIDSQARVAIISLITALEELGLIEPN